MRKRRGKENHWIEGLMINRNKKERKKGRRGKGKEVRKGGRTKGEGRRE